MKQRTCDELGMCQVEAATLLAPERLRTVRRCPNCPHQASAAAHPFAPGVIVGPAKCRRRFPQGALLTVITLAAAASVGLGLLVGLVAGILGRVFNV
jgi:hypothetical protein